MFFLLLKAVVSFLASKSMLSFKGDKEGQPRLKVESSSNSRRYFLMSFLMLGTAQGSQGSAESKTEVLWALPTHLFPSGLEAKSV